MDWRVLFGARDLMGREEGRARDIDVLMGKEEGRARDIDGDGMTS